MAVLVSGTGTILDAMLAEQLPVVVVLADRPCRALDTAAAAGIPTVLVDRAGWGGFAPGFDRPGFTDRVVAALEHHDVGLVAMAGFGTVLAPPFFAAFPGRVLNTHPALLPAFPGWHAVEDALAAGVAVTGCTVHVATPETDAGPVLAQAEVAVAPGDTAAALHERIKAVERRLYPDTIRAVIAGMEERGAASAEEAVRAVDARRLREGARP
ncbi:MAG TPA: phosphoribosylglycinamide formyltransferase [Acidimicrobiales bacterium]|nr:phosphoribosylglycinamide formyltransferase [Acidimicrobiales bacterium]